MFDYMFILKFVAVFLFSSVVSLESPEPEVLLQPRNYNPHPYREGGRVPPAIQALRHLASSGLAAQSRTGPVLFPPNPEDFAQSPGVDVGHPYASVARKQKNKLAGRFYVNDQIHDQTLKHMATRLQENNINPRVYSGLANYAAKVLKKPATTAQHNGFPDPSLSGLKKNYAFSYTVRDQSTGDDFSHSQSQSQNSAATNGEYRVKLPDGRVQIVSYTADKNGYKADVKYSDDDEQVHSQHQPRQHHQQQQQPVPAAVQHNQLLQPVQQYYQRAGHGQVQDYEYYDEPQRHHQQVTQIEVPVYDDSPYHTNHHNHKYQPEYVTIYPDKISSQYLVGDKVHIYPGSGAHDQQKLVRIGGNIQSPQKLGQIHGPVKLADKYTSIGDALQSLPYAHADASLLGQVGVSVSTASPLHYSQVYVTTPKYSLVHGNSHPASPTPAYYKRR